MRDLNRRSLSWGSELLNRPPPCLRVAYDLLRLDAETESSLANLGNCPPNTYKHPCTCSHKCSHFPLCLLWVLVEVLAREGFAKMVHAPGFEPGTPTV